MKYSYYNPEGRTSKFIRIIKDEGILRALKETLDYFISEIESLFLSFRKKRYFIFNGKQIPYIYHKYNRSWKNERALEIPLFLYFINLQKSNNKILEIGNVMNHYYYFKHDVLDKYEKFPNVINKDLLDFNIKYKYDFIFSISTFEHIGLDDWPKNSEKSVLSLKFVLDKLLTDKGNFILSFPVNYNSSLQELLNKNNIKNYEVFCFKKIDSKKNFWKQVDYSEIKNIKHEQPVRGVIFLKLNKKTKLK